jgi:hypothetical protein
MEQKFDITSGSITVNTCHDQETTVKKIQLAIKDSHIINSFAKYGITLHDINITANKEDNKENSQAAKLSFDNTRPINTTYCKGVEIQLKNNNETASLDIFINAIKKNKACLFIDLQHDKELCNLSVDLDTYVMPDIKYTNEDEIKVTFIHHEITVELHDTFITIAITDKCNLAGSEETKNIKINLDDLFKQ